MTAPEELLTPEQRWIYDTVWEVAEHAIDGDAERVPALLRQIDEKGPHAMLSALWCWSTIASEFAGMNEAIRDGHADGYGWRPLHGPVDESAPTTWAARFLCARVNNDMDTALALFNTLLDDPERYEACVAEVIADMVACGRAKEATS